MKIQWTFLRRIFVLAVLSFSVQSTATELEDILKQDLKPSHPRCIAAKASGAHYGWLLALSKMKEDGTLKNQTECKALAGKGISDEPEENSGSNLFIWFVRKVWRSSMWGQYSLYHHDYVTSCACEEVFGSGEDMSFSSRLDAFKKEANKLKGKVAKKKKQIDGLASDIEGLVREKAEEARVYATILFDIRNLPISISRLSNLVSRLRNQTGPVKSAIRSVKREIRRLPGFLRGPAERQLRRLEGQLSGIEERIDSNLATLAKKEKKLARQIRRKAKSEAFKARVVAKLAQKRNQITSVRNVKVILDKTFGRATKATTPTWEASSDNPMGTRCGSGQNAMLVPEGWGFPGGQYADFTDSCKQHDQCYDDQRGKEKCDREFWVNLAKDCREGFNTENKVTLRPCYEVVYTYYKAVDNAGDDAYKEAGE